MVRWARALAWIQGSTELLWVETALDYEAFVGRPLPAPLITVSGACAYRLGNGPRYPVLLAHLSLLNSGLHLLLRTNLLKIYCVWLTMRALLQSQREVIRHVQARLQGLRLMSATLYRT